MKPSKEQIELAALAGVGAAVGAFKYYVQPELSSRRGWLAVGGLVAAYELAAPEGQLLSEGADEAIKLHPYLTRAVIGLTALHLTNAFESVGLERFDPISAALRILKP